MKFCGSNRRQGRRQILRLIALLFTAASVPLNAQGSERQVPVINIDKSSWRVLFQGFVSQPGSQPVTSSIEKITGTVAKSLQNLDEHVLDDNEKNNLREEAIRQELFKHYQTYNDLVDTRDREAMTNTAQSHSKLAQISSQAENNKKINSEFQIIQQIKNMKRRLISVPDSLPLEFEDRSTEPYEQASMVLLREPHDIFIWGVSSGRNNIFQVEMRAYIANAKREVSLWKGIVGTNNYDEALEMIIARVSSLLLGRPWAAMEINAETANDSNAKIYLDGKLQGENKLKLYGLHPQRLYELEIMATGLQGKHVFVKLDAGKLNSFEFELNIAAPEKFIQVASSSPADVYLGVRFLGPTPRKIQVPAYDTLLVLVAEGKRTLNYDLSPEQEKDLYFDMEPAPQITLQEENDKWRNRFYWSSALFMLSLAVPVIASGIGFVNQGLYVNNQNNEDAPRYQKNMNIGFGVAIGGGLLSASLLGLNIYDFTRYTKTTRALASTEFEPRKVLPAEAETKVAAGPDASAGPEENEPESSVTAHTQP